MTVVERLANLVLGDPDNQAPAVPDRDRLIQRRDKARRSHEQWKPSWSRSLAYCQGRQFVVIDANTKKVSELETREFGAKPRWRSRTVRNRIQGYVASEISQATSRVPSYEVTPTTTDPADIDAARLASKVLLHFYDFLSMRQHIVNAYYYAVNCGEGFIRPYWNPNAGKEIPGEYDPVTGIQGPPRRQGDLSLRTYGPDQVYWEEGVRFDDAPVHFIDIAMSIEAVKALPGYNGTELRPDARATSTSMQWTASGNTNGDHVLVTEILEKPTLQNPEGRRVMVANNEVICDPEPYPCVIHGPDGPEPVLHRMSYFPTPDRDRDMGLTEHLVDPQAMLNLAVNKSADWVNYAMNPQWVTGPAGLRDRRTNEPGAVFRSKTTAEDVKPISVPQMPGELLRIAQMAIEDMEEISSQRGVPAGLESAKALSALIERDNIRRAFITQNLADFHARLGRHILFYIQKYYEDARLLAIQGSDGLDFIPEFKGADLRDQLNVRVLPGSIEPLTKQSIDAKVMSFADRGWITPQQAMTAINGGTAEDLVKDYELDVAKQQDEIAQMKALGDERMPGGQVPFADEFDAHPVHLFILERFMKTPSFRGLPPGAQEACRLHREQHKFFQQQEAVQEQMAMTAQAEQAGMQNAARPTLPKPMPDQPRPDSED